MDANGTGMGHEWDNMDGKKRARLIERGLHNYYGGTYEIWDVGRDYSVYVVYRVFATGEHETVAFLYDRIEHLTGTGVLGCWLGDATGGKAIRELGYEPIKGGDGMAERASSKVMHGDCLQLLRGGVDRMTYHGLTPVIVTDPPFNIGYHYAGYRDNMPEADYYDWIAEITQFASSVVVLYPESMHKLSIAKQEAPERVVSWVYNSNTAKQHRDIAFYGIKPDFNRVKQPYKNPNDKRIKARIAQGKGARLYDWWNINQVKNTNAEKTAHPCQMPVDVMKRAIGILPDGIGVIDPFCGSGTTGVACKQLGIPFEGYDINEDYCEIARSRIQIVDKMEVKE